MTLTQFAKLANVSLSVVSKAFSGKKDVSEAMREHVFRVAREYGCYEQFCHIPFNKPIIAVIIPEAMGKFYNDYIESLQREIDAAECTMLLSISNFDPAMEAELVRYYVENNKVDALISVDGYGAFPKSSRTVFAHITIEDKVPEIGVRVCKIQRDAMRNAIHYLQENGHTDIAYIGEPLTISKAKLFEETMREAGLTVREDLILTVEARMKEAGYEGVRRLLALDRPPTAIIGAYSGITKGALQELRARGFRVPEDFSLISMEQAPDPIDAAVDVALIDSVIDEMSVCVVNCVRNRLGKDEPNTPVKIEIFPTFHAGNSVGKAIRR